MDKSNRKYKSLWPKQENGKGPSTSLYRIHRVPQGLPNMYAVAPQIPLTTQLITDINSALHVDLHSEWCMCILYLKCLKVAQVRT